MEQERKHWLLRTDRFKTIQDPNTGDSFKGTIDNMGSNILLETEKLPDKDVVVQNGTFSSENVSDVLELASSTFPHIASLNGLEFARLKSINLMGVDSSYHNFRLVLRDCEIVYVPMSTNSDSSSVFTYPWYHTNSTPVLQYLDANDEYTIEVPVQFATGVANPEFYYPCDETLQPFSLTSDSDTLCETILITDPLSIGYPLFWFRCNESNIGPYVEFGNNSSLTPINPISKYLEFGVAGDRSPYTQNIYACTGEEQYSYPGLEGASTDITDWIIQCDVASGHFDNDSTDFDKTIGSIKFIDTTTSIFENITILQRSGINKITMTKNVGWEYDSVTQTYQIPLSTFISNLYENHTSLIPVFDIAMDQSVSFGDTTTDIGFAGIQMTSSNTDDQLPRYPHDINHLKGLPDWIQNDESGTPQRLSIYALHNTPSYAPEDQTTRQIAGLIFDPGKEKTYPDDPDESRSTYGRVYVMSNDDITYDNNATSEFPKPARTLARICDIPTSVMQLSNITGLSPTSVVDKKYVRSEASFTEADQQHLYNELKDKWVKPTHLDGSGNPIYTPDSQIQTNQFIFDSVENLERVDLLSHNDFRIIGNMNPKVDPQNVIVDRIVEAGSDYVVNDIGIIVVGGFSFNYEVQAVGDSGDVTEVTISPDNSGEINLSNFDLYDASYGLTKPYGSSPLGGSTGTGLKISFMIQHFEELLPTKGNVVDGLYAFVKERDGIWLYEYDTDQNQWKQNTCVATSNASDTISKNGSVSVRDSYLNSILPSVRKFTVSKLTPRQNEVTIDTFATASSLNVIDQNASPVKISNDTRTVVDINKLYCRGMTTLTATNRSVDGVITAIKEAKMDRTDSYVLWKWVSEDPSNLQFICGVLHRSLDNLISNADTSLLPDNDLNIKHFVNTNLQTSVVWNVDKVGPMVWIFDPAYTEHETYQMNHDTQTLDIERVTYSWDNVEVTSDIREPITILSPDGKLLYNVLTNSPYLLKQVRPSALNFDLIYQQPDYVQLSELHIGVKPTLPIYGAWRLVFPQIPTFKFTNQSHSYSATPMQILRGTDMTNIPDVHDENGNKVNYKTLIMNENTSTNRTMLNVFNPSSGTWDTI